MCVAAQMVSGRARRVFGLWLALCLCGSALLSAGCNPLSIGYLLWAANPNFPPDEFNFTDKKSNPKVLLLVSHASAQTQGSSDLFNADDLLALRLTQLLTKLYKESRNQVQLIPPLKVREFKAKHADWKLMATEDIAKEFGADYVVNMEITKLSLYEKESQLLYRGNAEIHISVVDANNTEDGALKNKPYVCTYPENGPVPTDEFSTQVFRAKFIDKMSRDLSRWFAPYPTETKHDFD